MLPNYTPPQWYECDLFVATKNGYSIEYEIKLSIADFKADFRKWAKHRRLLDPACGHPFRPTRFYYVVPEALITKDAIPDYAGLLYIAKVNSGWRRFVVQEKKRAPRLTRDKTPELTVQNMRDAAYYRFWNERRAFEDYVVAATATAIAVDT